MLRNVLELFYNLALLVALSALSEFIRQRRGGKIPNALLQGALFGLAAVIGMSRPLVLGPGLIFDGRSIMLSLCALFFGPLAALVAGLIAGLFRIYLGGVGVHMGTGVIAASVLLGLAGHYRWPRRGQTPGAARLLGFGALVHVVMVLLMFTLPGHLAPLALTRVGLPVLLAYPLVTLLIGKVLAGHEAALRSVEALRDSKEQFDDLAAKIPIGVYVLRSQPNGTLAFNYVSPRVAAITGLSLAALQAEPMALLQALHPEDVEAFVELNQKSLRELRPFTWTGRIRLGAAVTWVQITSTPERRGDGDVLWHGLVLDITETVLAAQALQAESVALAESERRFRSYVDHAPIAVFVCDPEGRLLEANPAASAITGFDNADLLTMSFPDLLPGSSQAPAQRLFQELRRTGQTSGECSFQHRDGHLGVWAVEGVRLAADRFMGLATDLTKRRGLEDKAALLQAQLQQTQKLDSLGSLAGGIAHDMNNVLGAILALASANLHAGAVGSQAEQAFATIIKAAERGGKMVKGLLSFARQTPAEQLEVDLNAVLREEIRLLERTTLTKVRLEVDFQPDLAPILGDAGALTHAFMNLCVNAVDAMPEPGTLTLRSRNAEPGWVEITVQDTGTGMTPEVLEKALDPFFTTKEVGKGTGLGLATVYRTVKAHQGQLSLQSEPGQGTCVRLRFPACRPAPATAEPAGAAPPPPPGGSLAVHLVDDDELIQYSIKALLEVLGHRVTVASSGEQALGQLDAGFIPDVVILDMNMPGLSGAETLPQLRARCPQLPVLLATGRADQTALDLVEAHPRVTLLSKPFSLEELRQNLGNLGPA